ncbi:hypothetical protein [Streptomyces sp. DH12]|uniref:hypothetical protein n=1 Tax=Streptomyces sp. DH12 TaxID=2857010 RepID=UPI001E42593C|nr:hypothetical protein [Streptomyces sp. DH12]
MTGTTAAPRAPRADCVADPAGGLTFHLAGHDPAAPDLVLRRTGPGAAGEVRLPLAPVGDGRSRAVLPTGLELAEGRWDVLLGDRPVEAGVRDVRALVDRTPEPSGPVAPRVPFPTPDGRLGVRAWLRPRHAEAGDITFGDAGCTVTGVLYGVRLGPGATAEARSDDQVHQVPAEGGRDTFAFTLPYAPLALPPLEGRRLWRLWLRPAAGADAVRIARVLDDVWDRRNVFVYPEHRGDGYLAAPCYTGENELCVRVTP